MAEFVLVLRILSVFNILLIQFSNGIHTVEGYTVLLKCPYKANQGRRLHWLRKNESSSNIYSENDKINTISLPRDVYERLTVTGLHTIGEYDLKISDIRESDQGSYECAISGTTNVNSQQLIVIDKPSDVFISNISPNMSDKRLLGTEDKGMLIKCTAVGGEIPPDVKLYISEKNVVNGKQSAQQTLVVNRSNDGQIVKCIVGYEELAYYPLTDSARIYLNLKPLPPTFIPDSVSTEETVPLVVSCISHGSRPAATIVWLIGHENSNITSHSTQMVVMNETTETYTITSTLTHSIDRSYNKQAIKCTASNIVSTSSEVFASTYLNIKYAPAITVENNTFHQSDLVRNISCIAQGNPSTYIYYKWVHFSYYYVKIREMQGSQNGVLTLHSLSEELSYQDDGLYLCTASNGIIGKDGKTKQASYGSIKITGNPVFTKENKIKILGRIGETVSLNVYVYSEPKYTMITWYRNGTLILEAAKYNVKDKNTIINADFHGTDIQIDGYKISLIIEDVRMEDFTDYNVLLSNGKGRQGEHSIYLVHGTAPQTPTNFTVVLVGETSITVHWKSADNGGYQQTFYVEYKVSTSSIWTKREIPTMIYGDENYVYELFSLQTFTYYNLRIFAANKINKSLPSIILTVQTLISDTENCIGNSVGILVFAVGISCILFTVVTLLVLGLIYYRRRRKFKTKRNKIESTGISLDNRIEDTDKAKSTRPQNDQHGCIETAISSYESLGVKDEPSSVYKELNRNVMDTSEKTISCYESLGMKDERNVYKELNRNVTDTDWKSKSAFESIGLKDKQNMYSEVKA